MQKNYRPASTSLSAGSTKDDELLGSTTAVSNGEVAQGVGLQEGADQTPFLSEAGNDVGDQKAQSTSTGALDAALSKVGKVDYVDPKHGKGDNKRDFKQSEFDLLVSGSDDIEVASCSPFTYWALENADKAANPDRDGSLIDRKIEGNTTVKDVVNCQSGARKGVKNNDGGAASWEDLVLGNVAEDEQWRGKGVAGAVSQADLGVEVAINEAKPGDLCQTWRTWSDKDGKFGFGGHSTQVHRVHAKGGAWFGVAGAPQLESVGTGCEDLDMLVKMGVCDSAGAVIKQPDMEIWIGDCTFRIDETTVASEVGQHTVVSQELIGAHNGGKNADTGEYDSGVFTREAEDLSEKHNDKKSAGAERVYLARLHESQWAKWRPADAGTHIQKIDIKPVARIEMDYGDQQLMPISAPIPDLDSKKSKKNGKRGGRRGNS